MMSSTNIVDSCRDRDLRGHTRSVKLEPDFFGRPISQKEYVKNDVMLSKVKSRENQTSSTMHRPQDVRSGFVEEQSAVDDSGLCSISPICPAPLVRQFWKAGNYDGGLTSNSSKPTHKNGSNHLHVHPKFLHSNATSHKWAFGAIAELLDNSIDEIQNGGTFVIVDKTVNRRDGSPALLIQDDGGGMDPEAMRHCMSFGFSDKKSKSAIGQYGNGFKTSTMRLGADAIVFSHSMKGKKTRSIGLLSYTFLAQSGLDRIVVPMIDYEFDSSADKWNPIRSEQSFATNLSLLLKWSPFSKEEDLLSQFVDIGEHGTKIIIYNLWLNDEGKTELDFDSDPEDIRLRNYANNNMEKGARVSITDDHLCNRLRFSMRAYLSILYLQFPANFWIVLCGSVVEYHNIASELKYRQCILYKPANGGVSEGEIITTIGFLKEAPLVNHHGFNVYHKNRLILPFWHVVSYNCSRGRGVVGVLEANFIQPTHNKQDFEKTSLFQKLEARLREMTLEYWDYHCGLIGYVQPKKSPATKLSQVTPESHQKHGTYQPVSMTKSPSSTAGAFLSSRPGNLPRTFHHNSQQVPLKRKDRDHPIEPGSVKQKVGINVNMTNAKHSQTVKQLPASAASYLGGEEAGSLLEENKKLRAQCLEHEKNVEELNAKVNLLRKKLREEQRTYGRLLMDLKQMEKT